MVNYLSLDRKAFVWQRLDLNQDLLELESKSLISSCFHLVFRIESSPVELKIRKKIKGRRGLQEKPEKSAEVRTFIVFKKGLIRVLKVNNFLLCSCFFDGIYSSESDDVCYNISSI